MSLAYRGGGMWHSHISESICSAYEGRNQTVPRGIETAETLLLNIDEESMQKF
jgi:hypothetical protein